MKSLNKVFVGMAALVLLTGCSGQKVSKDKFQAKIDALEAHEYSEATVKFDINLSGTTEQKEKGSVKFVKENGVWKTDDTKHAEYSYLLSSIKGMKAQDDSEKDGIKVTYAYYVNPLKVVTTSKGENKKDDNNYSKQNNKSTAVMDKYGYPTSLSNSYDSETKAEVLGVVVSVTMKGTEKFSISYK